MAKQASFIMALLFLLGTIIWSLPVRSEEQSENPYLLHAAAKRGDVKALNTLISDNIDINQQDADGWTALMHAVKAGNQQQIDILLKAGALPNIADKLGRTPLEIATKQSALITFQLIQAGADVNVRNAGGIPVIMIAAGKGRQDLVELLISAGARLDYKDYQGNTILKWSEGSGNTELTNYLKPRVKKAIAETPKESGLDFAEFKYGDAVHPEWFKHSLLDLDEDLNDALDAGKLGLMVYFGLKRCSYCDAFMENTLGEPDIEQRVRRLFDAVGMSIFSNNEMTDPTGEVYTVKDFVTEKKANYSPTLIFYGHGGRVLLKIVGYYPPDKFRRVLDYLEGGYYEHEKLYTYMNRHKNSSVKTRSEIKKDKLFPNKNYTLARKDKPAKRPLLVLFEQPDCDSCDRFHERVLTDKPIRRLLKQFDTLQLDATDTKTAVVTPEGSRIAAKTWYNRLGLNYYPAMVFYDEEGNEITRLDSETKRWRMEGTLQLILEKSYTKDTQVQRWRRDKAVMFYEQQQASQGN
jgi:thioredoxin-related protein